jgi:hypothetical protein
VAVKVTDSPEQVLLALAPMFTSGVSATHRTGKPMARARLALASILPLWMAML